MNDMSMLFFVKHYMQITWLKHVPLLYKEYIAITVLIIIGTLLYYLFFRDIKIIKQGILLCLIILVAYFSSNIWLFFAISFILINIFCHPSMPAIEKLQQYAVLLPLLPINFIYRIPFPGEPEQLFTINYVRMLNLFILLPIFFDLVIKKKEKIIGSRLDEYVLTFFLFMFIINFRDTSFTNASRMGFYIFLDYFLLYFVISRSLREVGQFRKIFNSMGFIALILAIMAIFETFKHWHMYHALGGLMNIDLPRAYFYKVRLGWLRAAGPFIFAPPLGLFFCMMTGILIFLEYFSPKSKKYIFDLLILLLFYAMSCTISMGSLVSYMVLLAVFILIAARNAKMRLLKLTILVLAFIFSVYHPLIVSAVSGLKKIGSLDKKETEMVKSIKFRYNLSGMSLKLLKRTSLTGSSNYIDASELSEVRKYGGVLLNGKIDIANTYLMISFRFGTVGILLFLWIFIFILFKLYKIFTRESNEERSMLGKVLFSTILSYMVMLTTMGLATFTPIYLWYLVGLSAAYIATNNNMQAGLNL